MDLDLFARLAERRRFEVIPRYLACFRVHVDSKSSTIQQVRAAEVLLLRREHGVIGAHPLRRLSWYSWYRAVSLIRKTVLQIGLLAGYEQLPVVPDFASCIPVKPDAEN